jgi:hypothetical protein
MSIFDLSGDASSPLPGYVGSLARLLLGIGGTYLMTHHVLASQGQVDTAVGIAMEVIAFVWVVLHNNKTASTINTTAASPATRSAPNVPL